MGEIAQRTLIYVFTVAMRQTEGKKKRKFAKNPRTLNNVLIFVEALLAVVYGVIPKNQLDTAFNLHENIPENQRGTQVEWEWIDNELMVSGKIWELHSKRTGIYKLVPKGITLLDLWKLAELYCQSCQISRSLQTVNGKKKTKDQANVIYDIVCCLEDLNLLTDKRPCSYKESKSPYWTFTLNLKYYEQGYEQARAEISQKIQQDFQDKYTVNIHYYSHPPSPEVTIENEENACDNTLYQALLKLDYSKQARLFEEVVNNCQVGACLIHGLPDSGQRWLLNRLIQEVPNGNTSNLVKKISFSRRTQDRSMQGIFKEICRKLQLPLNSSIEKIHDQLLAIWKTKTVILIFNKLHDIESSEREEYIEEFLNQFWQPLARLAKKGTTSKNYRLLLFLVDSEGYTSDWKMTRPEELLLELPEGWKPEQLIKFRAIEPITRGELATWLEKHLCPQNPIKFTETLADEILANSENGIHQYVFEEVCLRCNVQWEEQASSWLKY
ncbi:hypothetical protein PJF56_01530 [Roseofilum sp. BLCC_M91]|uniref:Uncharacterized protein n=1 Tax=Roseofilum halophilum BLCC-M91 TaxID=3022259 RepID=A0ABT7BED9_9CYAN|nr:hypothetical protein [Roseofilum halophilum]MDJ1177534.1 hypothetical protein [Roseofilum halophilum BLCC-M91]